MVDTAQSPAVIAEDNPPSPWKPHDHPDYDIHLSAACQAALRALPSMPFKDLRAFVSDPRPTHRKLYEALTPPDHPEYAGTYRGEPGTSLENRIVVVQSPLGGKPQPLQSPGQVPGDMAKMWQSGLQQLFVQQDYCTPKDVFEAAVKLFYFFGRIHPFLDGNGHIQRLIFAARIAADSRLTLHDSWTIHPRPYDIEVARVLELDDSVKSMQGLAREFKQHVVCR
ncbi:Fic family protein [Oleiagrimonas sp. MCCC 1A03011]|uniref:Fic family protein n=1 Tax=Oleiagrimonas sp. MCCC 1A03011 TaxID=1926883 RepID=UPI00143D9C5A|nr:Fic family protein [Oleiagrimonas sp. MCCC 1A03011]